jgi:excisionase family DNA binding protein
MDRYLTVLEVADLVRCEHRTVRRAIRRGELDAALIGGKWLIKPAAVGTWFDARRVAIPPPIPAPHARRLSRPGTRRAERPGSVARLQALDGS